MNIAIIGAGFSGLATAWHLLQRSKNQEIRITVFDSKGVGGGASGIAAGLLHPYAGAHAKLNRMGKEGMAATLNLLDVASKALGHPVARTSGILRLALTTDQEADFLLSAQKYPDDVQWENAVECHSRYPHLTEAPGIWLKDGVIVNSGLYLEGLWLACQDLGATFQRHHLKDLKELDSFDSIIIATGADCGHFPELAHLNLSSVKGQVLELEWPTSLPPLPFALNSHAYVLMTDSRTCIAGATFERGQVSNEPEVGVAIKDIMPKVVAMLPALEGAHVKGCHAAFRAVSHTHLPVVERLSNRLWVITGMGSKGLLYHALMAQRLVEERDNGTEGPKGP